MSDDLIKRSDAIEAVNKALKRVFADKHMGETIIGQVPSADRPQGEWIDRGNYAVCLNCGASSGTQFDGVEPVPLKSNYCPNCGAKMKGADDEVD